MAPRTTWRQEPGDDATRLDAALAAQSDEISRSTAREAVRAGLVRVNGNVVTRPALSLKPGDEVEAMLPDAGTGGVSAAEVPVNVIYKDEHIVVVDKPSGVTVHPGPGHADDTLVNGLLMHYPQMAKVGPPDRPGVVHRLDLDTSGLLIFALTNEALDVLGQAMRKREIKRTYTALVHGHIMPPEGTVDAPIGRDPGNRTRQAIVESGKPARTHYRLVEHVGKASLLEVQLDTGRMHQIRVHLTAIGFPVVGDPVYGRTEKVDGLDRQFLHAARLEFKHPVTGEPMRLESPLPQSLQAVLDRMRAQN